jgi:hypothetical protein
LYLVFVSLVDLVIQLDIYLAKFYFVEAPGSINGSLRFVAKMAAGFAVDGYDYLPAHRGSIEESREYSGEIFRPLYLWNMAALFKYLQVSARDTPGKLVGELHRQ